MDGLRLSALSVLVPLVGIITYQRWKARTTLPLGLTLPPGPPRLPILGSALDISRSTPWVTYTAWAEQYGPLIYVRLLGRDVIIINSEELAQELFEKRSAIYNDRPRYVTNEFFGLGFNSGFLPYGDTWRIHRRMLHRTLRPSAVQHLMYPIMLRKRRQLVKTIIDSPGECLAHLHSYSASVIMAAIYGYETQPKNDRLVHVVDRMLTFAMHSMTPEREALAFTFPIIKYIPTWMPGSRYRRDALQCRKYCKEMLEVPFEYTVKTMALGDTPPSIAADLLSHYAEQDDGGFIREAIKACTSTAFGAGFGTTETNFACFIIAMILHPHVQRRAQALIDIVVGKDRLPDFGDRSSLPYVDAILQEVWRWRPINPLAVPHATSQSDVYGGYYIPKGAMVLVNVWAMSRSEKYPDPNSFLPERFLSESGALTDDDVSFVFGAGRRKCVGRFFADATVWLTMVTLLSCFEFSKVDGWEFEDVEWTSGIAVSPRSFPFKVAIRDRARTVFADEV